MLTKEQGTSKTFFEVRACEEKGKTRYNFCHTVKEKTETSVERKNTDGSKTYNEERGNCITGKIMQVMTWQEESNDGKKQWIKMAIDILALDGKIGCLQMYYNSTEAESFLKRLPNVDLSLPVDIKISTQENGKYFNGMINLYQKEISDKVIPFHWNKENPLPKWKEVILNNKTVWDKTELFLFLDKIIKVKNAEIFDLVKAESVGIRYKDIPKIKNEELGIMVINYIPGEISITNSISNEADENVKGSKKKNKSE